MKNGLLAAIASFGLLVIALFELPSCSRMDDGYGTIRLHFEQGAFSSVKSSSTEVPDSSNFTIEITGSDGSTVYSGTYGNCPEELSAPSGSCVIKVRSCDFSTPKFSCPLYGDDQVIIVPSGGDVNVDLDCRQLNCGMQLKISSDFLTAYPTSFFRLKSDEGKLTYSYTEKRIAYFLPGSVSVLLYDNSDASETTLMTRTLSEREMLTVSINVSSTSSSSSAKGITMSVDTTRTWLAETYDLSTGSSSGSSSSSGTDTSSAMSVSEAKSNTTATDCWVYGYIVGGDLTSSSSGISFSAPFSSATNIAIAAKTSVSDKSSCLSVQLPSGDVRAALNLVDNPELLGRKVFLYGDMSSSYYGIPGIKNVTDYVLE